jgi:hypothetical protein
MILTILIISTLIVLATIIYGIATNNGDVIGVSLFIFLVVLLFGWGLIASTTTFEKKYIEISSSYIDVFKTDKIVIVVHNKDDIYEFDTHWEWVNLNDSTKFLLLQEYNMYGFKHNTDLVYEIEVD